MDSVGQPGKNPLVVYLKKEKAVKRFPENYNVDASEEKAAVFIKSFGEANDARAKRRLFRRLKECRANWPDTKLLHLIPNFDGEKDIEEKAPIVELSFKIYLIKDNKLVDNGSCIIASGGQVCYNSVFQKITEAFREKYD